MTEDPYTGDVFWCKDFPGLHGNPPKDRYAVIISPPDRLPDSADPDGVYLVVPASKSTLSEWAVRLPNRQENPQARSGLPSPCKAVCDQFKLVKRSALTEWKGDLNTVLVSKLQALVTKWVKRPKDQPISD